MSKCKICENSLTTYEFNPSDFGILCDSCSSYLDENPNAIIEDILESLKRDEGTVQTIIPATQNKPKNENVGKVVKSGLIWGAGTGLMAWGYGFIFVVVGFLLCSTGIGMILGIPMIIAGVISPFIIGGGAAILGAAGKSLGLLSNEEETEITRITDLHLVKLNKKLVSCHFEDDYNVSQLDDDKWNEEIYYFVNKIVSKEWSLTEELLPEPVNEVKYSKVFDTINNRVVSASN